MVRPLSRESSRHTLPDAHLPGWQVCCRVLGAAGGGRGLFHAAVGRTARHLPSFRERGRLCPRRLPPPQRTSVDGRSAGAVNSPPAAITSRISITTTTTTSTTTFPRPQCDSAAPDPVHGALLLRWHACWPPPSHACLSRAGRSAAMLLPRVGLRFSGQVRVRANHGHGQVERLRDQLCGR